jgi:hypothetical protein
MNLREISMQDEFIVIWESHKVEKPEFRLYYDDKGCVISYTCEETEGNYIVVDALTFAEARPDVRVVDGKIVKNNAGSVVSRLYKDVEGVRCETEDISVITEATGQYWKLVTINII